MTEYMRVNVCGRVTLAEGPAGGGAGLKSRAPMAAAASAALPYEEEEDLQF